MADVSRRSMFPPILRNYHSGIIPSPNPVDSLHAVQSPDKTFKSGIKHTLVPGQQPQPAPVRETIKGGRGRGAAGGTNQHPGGTLLTADKIKREHEAEQRRKRNQVCI